jgi:type I restriction enzyme S subunit
MWTGYHLNTFRDIAANKATTMGHIQRRHLTEAKVVCPPTRLIEKMTERFSPLIEKMINCRLESAQLGKTRDSLLPQLLSGGLSVSDVEG